MLLYHIPKELLGVLKRNLIKLYNAIPPVKEWPGILYRGMVAFGKGLKDFAVTTVKIIKEAPRAIYETTKFLLKTSWKAIKAIPGLIRSAAQAIWSGIKAVGSWVRDLVLKYPPHLSNTYCLVFSRSFTLSYLQLSISSALLLLGMFSTVSK